MFDEFEVKSKFRGSYNMPRKLWLDFSDKKLTKNRYFLLSFYIATADWDDRHKNFAISKISDTYLCEITGMSYRTIKDNKLMLCVNQYIDLIKGKNNQLYVKIEDPYQYFISMKKTCKKKSK